MSFVDKDDWAPGKRRFYDRLGEEKRLPEFRDFREKLKKSAGLPPTDCWRVAGSQYPPLDGSPMEYPPTEDVLGWLKLLGLNNPWDAEVVTAVKQGDDLVEETKVEDAKRETKSAKLQRSAASMEALVEMVESDRVTSELECARWAFDKLLIPWNKIDPDGVPSIGALGLLDFAKKNSAEFFRTIWTKMLPDRKAVEQAARFADDGRKVLSRLDEFDAESANSEVRDVA